MKRLIIIFIIVLIFTLGVGSLVWAQNGGSEDVPDRGSEDVPDKGSEDVKTAELSDVNPLGEDSIYTVLGRIIKALLGIVGSISLLMFIYGGITLLTSAGASEKIKKGQQTLVWASLGILVVFASYAVLKFVFSAFGL